MTNNEKMNIEYRLQSINIVILNKHEREKNDDNDENAIVDQILVRRSLDASF